MKIPQRNAYNLECSLHEANCVFCAFFSSRISRTSPSESRVSMLCLFLFLSLPSLRQHTEVTKPEHSLDEGEVTECLFGGNRHHGCVRYGRLKVTELAGPAKSKLQIALWHS